MNTERPFTHLIDIPLFASLTAEEEDRLLRSAARRRVAAHSVVQWEGEAAKTFSVLLSGKARAVLQRSDGGEILLRFLRPGDFFGELNLFGAFENSFTVIAAEDCQLLVISLRAMADLMHDNPNLAGVVLAAMARQVLQSHVRLRTLSADRSERRVLGVLRELAVQVGVNRPGGVLIPEKLSHQTIADCCGLTRETVTRLLGRLRQQDLVQSTRDGWLVSATLFGMPAPEPGNTGGTTGSDRVPAYAMPDER